MKSIVRIALATVVAASMLAIPVDSYSQSRSSSQSRTSSGSSSSRSSSSSSSSSSRSSSSSMNSRSSSSSSRSSAAVPATQSRSTSSQSRGSATTSRSSSSSSRSTSPATQNRTTTTSSSSRNSSATQNRNGSTSSRSSATTSRSSSPNYGTSGQNTRNGSATSSRSSSTARTATPLGSSSRSSVSRSSDNSRREQAVGNATRNGLSTYSANSSSRNNTIRETKSDFMRIGDDRNVHRIPPRERDFMPYDRPCHFWGHDPHYYGYRVHALPHGFRRMTYWGVEYCFHNGIYYRPYGSWYVVCRPPFGICIEAAIDRAIFSAVHFAYFNNSYRIYNAIDANNRVIDEQNRLIAQNNATIAAQNNAIALNTNRANDAYSLANSLGLVQSYAYANQEYFYQDGVFYIINSRGKYEVIVPPAGALVSELPDDYDTITLGNATFYKVDDTVYRVTLVDGTPYLEVLGQMYGDLSRKYNYYSNSGNGMKFNDLY